MESHSTAPREFSLGERFEVLRQPLWWLVTLAILALPTVAGLSQVSSVSIQAPIELFELGFEYLSLIFPLLAVGIYVVAFSSETANRWVVYVRSRIELGRYLRLKASVNAALSFGAFFVAIVLWGVLAFVIGPAAGWAPNGDLPELSAAQIETLTRESATFTQLAAVGTWAYVLAYAAWVGLWAALFATVGFLLLLLTGNRLIAFTVPVLLYWVENIVLALSGWEQLRSVTAVFPFAIVQQPIGVAIVPLAAWGVIAAILAWKLRSRNLEVSALL